MEIRFKFQDKASYDDFGDSDNEAEPDAYLARVKAEGKARDSDDDDGSNSDESTDDDFNPDAGKIFDKPICQYWQKCLELISSFSICRKSRRCG